jgi:arabinogalactan endo-1,4-beta-galactosidase
MNAAFIKGMDVSFLDEIEEAGGLFYENGEPRDCLDILKANGVNSIRLRIWNEPPHTFCNLERTIPLAKRIKAKGFHFLLDFHYSDLWADPGKQFKPKAWEALDVEGLKSAVYEYTEQVMTALKEADALPDMVQIGNEITPGMLWPAGKVDGEYDTDEQWETFASLVKAGIDAAKTVHPEVNLMIHIDRGGDHAASVKFYDRFEALGVAFDTIGLSFYPWWHCTLEDLRANLHGLAARYGKEIVVVETAYPWTTEKKEGLEFIVNADSPLNAVYPATVEGQAGYLRDFMQIVADTPNGLGVGFHWWEPCWIPAKEDWSVGHPNNWSNLTLFDFQGNKLQSIEVLRQEGGQR